MMRTMMKMDAISTITVLLLFCSVSTSADSKIACLYAVTNDDVTVPLQHALQPSEQLKWKHNSSTIFHQRQKKVMTGKETDISNNGSLKLTKVDENKSGEYTPEVFDGNGKAIGNLKSTHLCILDRVKKPTVKIDCLLSSQVKFTCVGQVKDLQFTWLNNGKLVEKETQQTLTRKAKEVEKDSFSCKVSNQVSSETSAPVKQNCIKPSTFLPDEIFGINTWIIVGLGAGVVLVLIIITIACCIRNRRKKRMQVKDEEELRLGFTNPNQQHHHQHNHPPGQHHHQHNHPPGQHHHQQQPAGHTGPRQHRPKQQRNQQRPRAPDHLNCQPQPSPRRAAQGPRPVDNIDDEQPPPLPQPRKKAPKTQRV